MLLLTALLLIVAVVDLTIALRPRASAAPARRSLCARLTVGRVDVRLSLAVFRDEPGSQAAPLDRARSSATWADELAGHRHELPVDRERDPRPGRR